MGANLKVEWVGTGCAPQCQSNPAYPEGVDLVDSPDAPEHCVARLTYPAPCCGVWIVRCDYCRRATHISAAGRADDPRSVSLACVRKEARHGS